MYESGIFLGLAQIQALPEAARAAVFEVLGRPAADAAPAAAPGTAPAEGFGLAVLSRAQFAKFMDGLSDKTARLLKLFAVKKDGAPLSSELMQAAGYSDWQDLRGFLAGLTKRARTVTGERHQKFWRWEPSHKVQSDAGQWEDGPYYLHPTTLQSLRDYFRIRISA